MSWKYMEKHHIACVLLSMEFWNQKFLSCVGWILSCHPSLKLQTGETIHSYMKQAMYAFDLVIWFTNKAWKKSLSGFLDRISRYLSLKEAGQQEGKILVLQRLNSRGLAQGLFDFRWAVCFRNLNQFSPPAYHQWFQSKAERSDENFIVHRNFLVVWLFSEYSLVSNLKGACYNSKSASLVV